MLYPLIYINVKLSIFTYFRIMIDGKDEYQTLTYLFSYNILFKIFIVHILTS